MSKTHLFFNEIPDLDGTKIWSRPATYTMCRARLYTNYHTSEEKDHKHGKRSHIYIVQGEKMVFIRILQQNIMIVIKHTRTHTENNGGLISKIIIFKSNTS